MNKEKCIMPPSLLWETERREGLHRHEIFYGKNRQKSIEDGLVVFLTPARHNGSSNGVHYNHDFDMELKCEGQRAAMKHYGWTTEEFIARYGRNYLAIPRCDRCGTYTDVSECMKNGYNYLCECCYDDLFYDYGRR